MSRILVRKAFEIVQNEIKSEDNLRKKKPSAGLAKKYGIRKQKSLRKFPQLKTSNMSLLQSMKLASDKTSKGKEDNTEENIDILLRSKYLRPRPSSAQKVLQYHEKQLKKRIIEEPEVKEPEPESVLFPELNKPKKRKK